MDGGFDPVPIQASADDLLEVTVFGPAGITAVYKATVPKRRPPSIVRTNPPRGRADVALSVRPIIVFSEPIDPATVRITSIRLLENGALMPGTVQLSIMNGWTAEVAPAMPLKPNTTYQLQVTQDIRDLDGDALRESAVTDFTTGAAAGPGLWPTSGFAYVAGHELWLIDEWQNQRRLHSFYPQVIQYPSWAPDGSRVALSMSTPGSNSPWTISVWHKDGVLQHLSPPGVYEIAPSWSPDGSRIAFISRAFPGGLTDREDIWVMSADGTNRLRLTAAGRLSSPGFPAWSPDGSWIAYSWFDASLPQTGIYVIRPDGTQAKLVAPETVGSASGQRPAWSPDGKRLAFVTGDGRGIAMIDIDGSDLSVMRMPMWVENLAWSPDGAYVAFNDNCLPNEECYPGLLLLRIADGSLTRLNLLSGYAPTWVW